MCRARMVARSRMRHLSVTLRAENAPGGLGATAMGMAARPPPTNVCRELCIAASAAPSGTSIICGGLPPTAATSPPPPPKMESQSCGTACPAPAVCMPGGASPAASDPTWPCIAEGPAPATWNAAACCAAAAAASCTSCRPCGPPSIPGLCAFGSSLSCSCVLPAPPSSVLTSVPTALDGPAPSSPGVQPSAPLTTSRSDDIVKARRRHAAARLPLCPALVPLQVLLSPPLVLVLLLLLRDQCRPRKPPRMPRSCRSSKCCRSRPWCAWRGAQGARERRRVGQR
mmetsp:Transcript_36499/g.107799  ORF Transcript_36499/g.107799 Transcript_36499/m.107799 type:complete len:284 (-) Transcript_36499:209-1060(-)